MYIKKPATEKLKECEFEILRGSKEVQNEKSKFQIDVNDIPTLSFPKLHASDSEKYVCKSIFKKHFPEGRIID